MAGAAGIRDAWVRKQGGVQKQGGQLTDQQDARALTGEVLRSPDMSPAKCAGACVGYPWFGLEYGTQCFCGLHLGSSSENVRGYECAMECGGDSDAPCGDADRLNVYFNPNVRHIKNPKSVGNYSAKGCFTDSQSTRSLSDGVLRRDDMSIERCATFCEDFSFFGLEYGSQCFCGNSLSGKEVSENQCGMLCTGNESQRCGSADRLTVYSLNQKGDQASEKKKVSADLKDEIIAMFRIGKLKFRSALRMTRSRWAGPT